MGFDRNVVLFQFQDRRQGVFAPGIMLYAVFEGSQGVQLFTYRRFAADGLSQAGKKNLPGGIGRKAGTTEVRDDKGRYSTDVRTGHGSTRPIPTAVTRRFKTGGKGTPNRVVVMITFPAGSGNMDPVAPVGIAGFYASFPKSAYLNDVRVIAANNIVTEILVTGRKDDQATLHGRVGALVAIGIAAGIFHKVSNSCRHGRSLFHLHVIGQLLIGHNAVTVDIGEIPPAVLGDDSASVGPLFDSSVCGQIAGDLVVGNFSQYTWWYIRRCYGLIMEKDFGNKISIPNNEIGKVSKRGYVLSQFARFVRPGAVRVGATASPEKLVYASAYKSAGGDSVIVVLVNRDFKNDKSVTIKVQGADVKSFHMYTTSEAKNAKDEGEVEVNNGSVTIKMESGATNKDCIVTLVGVGTPADPVPREPFGGKVAEIPGKIEVENFDIPGTGKANKSYNENDSDDRGAESNDGKSYREGTGVDIYKKATGYVVGYNEEGEWLEYSVNVKEAGDYTVFASVATSNSTSGFSLSLDGDVIAEKVALSGTSFDEFTKVKTNVKLPAGEHILRMTVTGSWFDIDYLNFVKGKDATDPDEQKNSIADVRMHMPTEAENYRVFDVNGMYVGMFKAMTKADVQNMTKKMARQSGVYFVKSVRGGKSYRISVTK